MLCKVYEYFLENINYTKESMSGMTVILSQVQLMTPLRSIYWRIAMVGKVFLIGDTEKSNYCLYKKANDNYTLCFTFHTLSGCTHSFTDHGQTLYNWSSHAVYMYCVYLWTLNPRHWKSTACFESYSHDFVCGYIIALRRLIRMLSPYL